MELFPLVSSLSSSTVEWTSFLGMEKPYFHLLWGFWTICRKYTEMVELWENNAWSARYILVELRDRGFAGIEARLMLRSHGWAEEKTKGVTRKLSETTEKASDYICSRERTGVTARMGSVGGGNMWARITASDSTKLVWEFCHLHLWLVAGRPCCCSRRGQKHLISHFTTSFYPKLQIYSYWDKLSL